MATDAQSTIEGAAARLRTAALEVPAGTPLGGEEALRQRLGVSRPTLRQAARIVEREGLLRVRRGNAGGYFAARPDPEFIEATVASYLEMLHADPEDLARVATALWIEAVAKAAAMPGDDARMLDGRLRAGVRAVKPESGFAGVMAVERKVRRAIFDLTGSSYVELIFNINANFARRSLVEPTAARDATPEHADFVAAWRAAMSMQLAAISDGDVEVATLAARRVRALIHDRVWPRPAPVARQA